MSASAPPENNLPPPYEEQDHGNINESEKMVTPAYGYPNPGLPQSNIGHQPIQTGFVPGTVIVHQPQTYTDIQPGDLLLINDYTGLSVFSCLCCCWLLGIFAIVFSCLTSEAKRNGNYPDAKKYSKIAKMLSLISIFLGIILIAVILILQFIVLQHQNNP